jgi:hypothetical protein
MAAITRVDLCHSEDDDTKARLLEVIAELGGRSTHDRDDAGLGAGVNRFVVGSDELTVYIDAWGVDLAGPDGLVRKVLATMAGL